MKKSEEQAKEKCQHHTSTIVYVFKDGLRLTIEDGSL
jgi:hypothetical protein